MKPIRLFIYHCCIGAGLLCSSCEYDLNRGVDFISPQAVIEADTLEAYRGDVVKICADIADESGISYISLEYADWGVEDSRLFEDGKCPNQYFYSYEVSVPDDAALEWDEVLTKNDGSKFNIVQCYHRLSLTCYDAVNNKHIFYYYIKVK